MARYVLKLKNWPYFAGGSWRLYDSLERKQKFKLHLKESLLIKRDKLELKFIATL